MGVDSRLTIGRLSSDEPENLSPVSDQIWDFSEDLSPMSDHFWSFYSCDSADLKKWNDIIQGDTRDGVWIPKLPDTCSTDFVESEGDSSELSFYQSYNLEVDGILDAPPSQLDSGLSPISSFPVGFKDMSPTHVKRDVEDLPDVASSMTNIGGSGLDKLRGRALRFVEPYFGALVRKAARLVSTT